MAAMPSRMTDAPVPLNQHVPTADQFVRLRGGWETYEGLLALRGERRSPRIAYLDGVVELMSPSRSHEGIGYAIAWLISEYCLAKDIPVSGYRSWTQKAATREAGLEPDECFVFGDEPQRRSIPDLAIEVIWTSGSIAKLEIYERLAIPEVWFWKDDVITVHLLERDGYVRSDRSRCLPALDLALISRLAAIEPTSEGLKELRAVLARERTGQHGGR